MILPNRRARPDQFDVSQKHLALSDGSGFIQKDVFYDADHNAMSSTTVCVRHPDGVAYIINDNAYDFGGRLMGTVDRDNGNALVAAKPPAPKKKRQSAKAKAAAEAAETEAEKPADAPSGTLSFGVVSEGEDSLLD